MKKRMAYSLIITLGILIAAVLYLLASIEGTEEMFGAFNLSFAIVVATAIPALLFILRGVLEKNPPQFKQLFVIVGVGFLLIAIIALIGALAIPSGIVVPIISIVLALGLVLMVLARGVSKWDKGHNQEKGYKNYHQRKAEEATETAPDSSFAMTADEKTTNENQQ